MIKMLLEHLLEGNDLDEHQAEELLVALTEERMAPPVAGALLAALRAKGETSAEIRGFARGMRRLARRPELAGVTDAVDVVGTGGDGSGSVNISTGAALLAAACGVKIVKHGNRSISSKSGSADLLEALGLPMPLNETIAGKVLDVLGFTFLFAPYYHPAMKAVAPIRRALGIRTIFNVLGPLTNPAEPPFLLVGAFSPDAARRMAETLAGLPLERAFVVHGEPGWDEPTPVGPYQLFDVHAGQVAAQRRDPAEVGLARCEPDALRGGDATTNARLLREVFYGARNPHRDALLLSAGLVLELTGRTVDLEQGVAAAAAAVDDGRAAAMLVRLGEAGEQVRSRETGPEAGRSG